MTLLDPGTDVADFVRDQWQRPLIVPPGGGPPVPYTRASSAAKTVEDHYNLEMWARRNVAFGMARDPSLVARVLAAGGDPSTWSDPTKRIMDRIHEDAAAVAAAHRSADIGTAVHRLTERLDRGEQVIAGPYEPDLEAYVNALIVAGLSVTHVECRMVCDTLELAGTADRIVTAEGRHRILDLKTGASVQYGALGWAAQLAAYAHGQLYDVDTGERLDTPPLDRAVGYICHLPAGEGVCRLYEIDLVAGHRAAVLANEIRAIRKESRRWISPLAPVPENGPGSNHDGATVAAGEGVAPAATDLLRHPSARDRREELRARFRALTSEQQEAFRARAVDADDLDAVQTVIAELEQGAAAAPPAVAAAPTPADIDERLGHGHDEGDAHPDGWDELESAYLALAEPVRSWFAATIAEANRAGVPLHAHYARTTRRYHLYRGLLVVAATFDDATDDLADIVRGVAGHVIGDAAFFPTVTVGHAVGAMSATEAKAFAEYCALYVEGHMPVDYGTGHLRLVPS